MFQVFRVASLCAPVATFRQLRGYFDQNLQVPLLWSTAELKNSACDHVWLSYTHLMQSIKERSNLLETAAFPLWKQLVTSLGWSKPKGLKRRNHSGTPKWRALLWWPKIDYPSWSILHLLTCGYYELVYLAAKPETTQLLLFRPSPNILGICSTSAPPCRPSKPHLPPRWRWPWMVYLHQVFHGLPAQP